MLRSMFMLLVLSFAFGAPGAFAQAKKTPGPGRTPSAKDSSIAVSVFMRDAGKNELMIATRIWPDFPDYNAAALQRFFALMKSLEPGFKQDDEVAYSWAAKAKVAKCSIYLESAEAGAKGGTGAIVGCEANGVSNVAVTSAADPKHPVSLSQDPKHLADVMDLFRKQTERARNSLPKQ